MATKLDLSRPLFMGPNAARENTVVDHIRRAVQALDTGSGVPYATLEEYLLRNYTPAKSQNYNSRFIKSYVRDAVNKYGHLSYVDEKHEYKAEAGPQPRTPRGPKRPSKAKLETLSVLKFIRDAGEVADAGDVDNTQITPQDIANELGKRQPWVDTRVERAVEEGYARVETTEGQPTLVYLTAAGYAAVNAEYPEGAESAPGAGEAGDFDAAEGEEEPAAS